MYVPTYYYYNSNDTEVSGGAVLAVIAGKGYNIKSVQNVGRHYVFFTLQIKRGGVAKAQVDKVELLQPVTAKSSCRLHLFSIKKEALHSAHNAVRLADL